MQYYNDNIVRFLIRCNLCKSVSDDDFEIYFDKNHVEKEKIYIKKKKKPKNRIYGDDKS
jgi:hypothetical protein